MQEDVLKQHLMSDLEGSREVGKKHDNINWKTSVKSFSAECSERTHMQLRGRKEVLSHSKNQETPLQVLHVRSLLSIVAGSFPSKLGKGNAKAEAGVILCPLSAHWEAPSPNWSPKRL